MPVEVEWSRHYGVPSLGLWLFFFAVALIPPHNRNWRQAYHIVLPVLLGLLFAFFSRMGAVASKDSAAAVCFFISLAIAWETVWLLGPWISQKDRVVTAILAWCVLLLVGVISYVSYNGINISWGEDFAIVVGGWIMLTSTMITSYFLCGLMQREGEPPSKFTTWTFVFTLPIAAFWGFVFFLTMTLHFEGPDFIVLILQYGLIFGVCFACVVTLVFWLYNLPFYILAFVSEKHRERLYSIFPPAKPPRGGSEWDWKSGPASKAFPPPLKLVDQRDPSVAPQKPFGEGAGRVNQFGKIE